MNVLANLKPTKIMRIAIVSLVLVSACASAASSADPSAPRVQVIQADGVAGSLKIVGAVTDASSTPLNVGAEEAFQVMPLVYDSLSIPKTWLEPKQFMISSQGFKIRARMGKTVLSRYIDCGSTQIGNNADSYDVFMTVTSKLVPNGKDASTLSTTVEASAKPLSFNQEYANCSSRGELERRVADVAKEFLKK
ncbi:MAG TPA: hypothetical protein VF483_07330 [Gemmatimonadaceae bacterium]